MKIDRLMTNHYALMSISRASYLFSFEHDGRASKNRKIHIEFRDNQTQIDDFMTLDKIKYKF